MDSRTEDTLASNHCAVRVDSIFDLAEFGLSERMKAWIRDWQAKNPNVPLDYVLNSLGAWYRTPAHWASECNQPQALKALLELGADSSAREESGMTPLHFAVLSHSFDCCRTLIQHNPQLRHIKDDYGLTPIDMCSDEDIKELLLTCKAEAPKTKKIVRNLLCTDLSKIDLEELKQISIELKQFLAKTKLEIENKEKERAQEILLLSPNSSNFFCVICMASPKSILLQPCNHLCVCKGCTSLLANDLCPVCRSVIQQKIQVYF
eukprot:TRINITY_DN7190_c0_g4_i2.p1 TRINITY_DN7190_c0_g4~~TRINITY_DN7190_c0_g4_i2.p1  ORF type:complete len:263 (-),score=40.17 TRINITY_DN7190_c0_g4_i2:187-975(-)